MKFVRVAAMALVLLVALAAALAGLAYQNQARLVKLVLLRFEQRTGLHVVISGSRLAFRGHLILVFEHPRVFEDGREIASLDEIRAQVAYHALLHGAGLPLYALALDKLELRLPGASPNPASMIPRLENNSRDYLTRLFANLSAVTRRLSIHDGAVIIGGPLARGLELRAYHAHSPSDQWFIHIRAEWMRAPLTGLRANGNLRFGADRRLPGVILHGRIRLSSIPLSAIHLAGVRLGGQGGARLAFRLHYGGGVSGSAAIALRDLALDGAAMKNPLELGDYGVDFAFNANVKNIGISDFTVQQAQTRLISGTARLRAPYSSDPVLGVHLRQTEVNLPSIRKLLSRLRRLPPDLVSVSDAIEAGHIAVDNAAFRSPISVLMRSPAADLQNNLLFTGAIANVRVKLPPGLHLPLVDGLSAQLAYAHGLLAIAKGSAKIGDSVLSSVNCRANLPRNLSRIKYALSVNGDFAAGQLYRIALDYAPGLGESIKKRVWKLEGRAAIALTASGEIRDLKPGLPADFLLRLMPSGLLLSFNAPSATLIFTGGELVLRPGMLRIDRLEARTPGGPNTPDEYGHMTASGDLSRSRGRVVFHNLALALHHISASRWLPMALETRQIAVRGKIDGHLLLDGFLRGDSGAGNLRIIGRLTLGAGELRFAFLRAPLVVKTAALIFNGSGLKLSLPGAEFEGSPLVMSLLIPDLTHPAMELDASVQRLDLQALTFIRLPWTPPTPVTIFKIPVHGHLKANVATIAMMRMTAVSTDYSYDRGNWYVRDFEGQTLGGKINLNLTGRSKDNWIHIAANVDKINAGQLLMLLEQNDQPQLTGVLTMNGDLWADTSTNFFQTLAGALSINAENGRLNRFTLLSRILGLIDLKSWLTASVPDPRLHGLSFDSLTADFKGDGGVFYTDDLRLTGPVMDILAQGVFRTGNATLDMRVGMVPFNTVAWLISKIPLIGNNLSQASGQILAAYFQVRGPVANPHVTPKPITSVAEFVKKILSLPINTVRPNTVR
ncbi:MAG: AsmA-like C-terminal domain-containing protein [Candidatus Binataceae bacterium]